ncbi:MAG: hypothetical protein LBK76_03455 [Verrucomicrobiales bacterium]|jgi:hypothetical protein|nr:hypothetical protein [Verrucomicrobiales bacterium]
MTDLEILTEKLFAAWLAAKAKPCKLLRDCRVTPALSDGKYTYPALIVSADTATELAPCANVFELPLTVVVASIPKDDAASVDTHRRRVARVRALLLGVDSDLAEAQAAAVCAELNTLALGVTVSGYTPVLGGGATARADNHIADSLALTVTVSLGNS